MAVDNTNVVDFISTKDDTNEVYLTISDHLDWSSVMDHLLLLQEKINAYLGFIESGDLYTQYPLAYGKQIVINVVGKYDLTEEAIEFYAEASVVALELNTMLRFSSHVSPDL
jgi:hypothetical protein